MAQPTREEPSGTQEADAPAEAGDGPPPGLQAYVYGDRVLFVHTHEAPVFPVGLTEAERAVATQIVEGASNQQIAALRGTSARTVANQVAGLFRKCGVGSRAELVVLLRGAGVR